MRNLVIFFVTTVLLFSCRVSQETLDRHEDIRSRLKEYEEDDFYKENYNDTVFTDYVALNYPEFRKKYNLSHRHMNIVANTNEASVSILKAARSIENLKKLADSAQTIRRIDTSKLNFYRFDKIMPIRIDVVDTARTIDTSDTLYQMMLEFDADTLNRD